MHPVWPLIIKVCYTACAWQYFCCSWLCNSPKVSRILYGHRWGQCSPTLTLLSKYKTLEHIPYVLCSHCSVVLQHCTALRSVMTFWPSYTELEHVQLHLHMPAEWVWLVNYRHAESEVCRNAYMHQFIMVIACTDAWSGDLPIFMPTTHGRSDYFTLYVCNPNIMRSK